MATRCKPVPGPDLDAARLQLIAVAMCKFANGRCECAEGQRRCCESTVMQAGYVLHLARA